jgi:hypothetical protein
VQFLIPNATPTRRSSSAGFHLKANDVACVQPFFGTSAFGFDVITWFTTVLIP